MLTGVAFGFIQALAYVGVIEVHWTKVSAGPAAAAGMQPLAAFAGRQCEQPQQEEPVSAAPSGRWQNLLMVFCWRGKVLARYKL